VRTGSLLSNCQGMLASSGRTRTSCGVPFISAHTAQAYSPLISDARRAAPGWPGAARQSRGVSLLPVSAPNRDIQYELFGKRIALWSVVPTSTAVHSPRPVWAPLKTHTSPELQPYSTGCRLSCWAAALLLCSAHPSRIAHRVPGPSPRLGQRAQGLTRQGPHRRT
jgi:hypothetical protein